MSLKLNKLSKTSNKGTARKKIRIMDENASIYPITTITESIKNPSEIEPSFDIQILPDVHKIKPKTKKNRLTIINEKSLKQKKPKKKTIRLRIMPEIIYGPSSSKSPEGIRYNEQFIEVLEKLADIMMKRGEMFRAKAYLNAKETIMSFNEDITSVEQLKNKPGIGKTIIEKLEEYVKTGTLELLEREKNNPINIIADIYGIGPKKAKELVVTHGIKTIDELRERQNELLNDKQKIGLKYYEDILKRIPRNEIEQFENIFKKTIIDISKTDSTAKLEVVGSYRRGAESSGDIDVIITSEKSETFKDFLDKLIENKTIIEVLSRGSTKSLTIAKISESSIPRRVDFLYTTPDEYPFSVLYFTGSKIFNTVMRHHALSKGYTLNEHELSIMEGKTKGKKVEHVFQTEKDIFDFLGLAYKSPNERIDGRAIQPITQQITEPITEPIVSIVESQSPKENVVLEISEIKTKKNKTQKKPREKKCTKKDNVPSDVSDIENESAVKENIQLFRKNGMSALEKMTQKQLSEMLLLSQKIYYNKKESIITDNEYDIIKDYTQEKYPNNVAAQNIGAPVERNKVELPYPMGSMDKIKPDTNILDSWKQKYTGPYVISCKLDGVSGLYTTEGDVPKLYTRGDGRIGQDISYLIPYLKLPKMKNLVIRGEFIIQNDVFDKKYSSTFANARNLVSGIINRQSIDEKIKDIHFVAYEVMKPVFRPAQQMMLLENLALNIEVVKYSILNDITNESLSEILQNWRTSYEYQIDGIIVCNDAIYPREYGNPKHAFAFKMVLSDQMAEAKVVDVIWNASKDGYLKPRVRLEPVTLGGVRIEYTTGFNGAFIEQNKIGIGAIIQLIRSGDVIPYIKSVIQPAEHAKMPDVPYVWNDTHVDVLLKDVESDSTVREKNIAAFFKKIEVDGLKEGNISRLISGGYDSVAKILKMKIDDFMKVDGFKERSASKIYNSIKEKVNTASLVTIMTASNTLGRGISDKKIELILQDYPNILTSKESDSEKINKLSEIKGMAKKTAEVFVLNIPKFLEFLKECGLENKLNVKVAENKKQDTKDVSGHPLFEKKIVITGFRDKELENKLKSVNVNLGSAVSKNTFLVITKDKTDSTGKLEKARELGITILTPDELVSKYFK